MLNILIRIFVLLVALEHIYFLWLEMFVWETVGERIFKHIPPEAFSSTKTFAANQGLYNGFLAAGLIWSLFISDRYWRSSIQVFFLLCIAVAGVYGGISVSQKIFFIQSAPAIISLILVLTFFKINYLNRNEKIRL